MTQGKRVQVAFGFVVAEELAGRSANLFPADRGLAATTAVVDPDHSHPRKLVVCCGGDDDDVPSAKAAPEIVIATAAARADIRW